MLQFLGFGIIERKDKYLSSGAMLCIIVGRLSREVLKVITRPDLSGHMNQGCLISNTV